MAISYLTSMDVLLKWRRQLYRTKSKKASFLCDFLETKKLLHLLECCSIIIVSEFHGKAPKLCQFLAVYCVLGGYYAKSIF